MPHVRFRLLLALLLLSAPVSALAGEWCVHTAQELHDALLAAKNSSDTSSIVKVRQGTYTTTATSDNFVMHFIKANQTVEISGGWSGITGLCQERNPDPSLTVLVGSPDTATLSIDVTDQNDAVRVSGLTLRNPAYTSTSAGACLNAAIGEGSSALFERLRMEQCVAANASIGTGAFSTHGQLDVRDVSVRGGSALSNGGLTVTSYANAVARLAQISVTDTHPTEPNPWSSGLSLSSLQNGEIHLDNSVVWGNHDGTYDLYLYGTNVHLTRVHYGSLDGQPASNVAPGTGDPGFVAAGDAHLRADSILVDSGIANPAAGIGDFDADGRARVQGAAVDVGAFESTYVSDLIFADGFN